MLHHLVVQKQLSKHKVVFLLYLKALLSPLLHYLAPALPLTSQRCFLVSRLMRCAISSPATEARFYGGGGSREVTDQAPSPPSPAQRRPARLRPPPSLRVLPRQARRSLACLVETAPLRLARSAAVRAQLRLPGAHVARFHL